MGVGIDESSALPR